MIWIDAQLSPFISDWISEHFLIECHHLRDLNLRDAIDVEIFNEARLRNAVIITKDSDFIDLVKRMGTPPKIIWLTCGNTSNNQLKIILTKNLKQALEILEDSDVVEITG